jgi:hypothetical protein
LGLNFESGTCEIAVDKERILITVKTYPTLSRKYGETVCTAGVREDGSWIRLYPVPFRRLQEKEQYSKYDWIECRVVKNKSDPRPESFRPFDPAELVPVGHMDTKREWSDRRRLLLETSRVCTRRKELIDGAKTNEMSLAVFKPTRLLKFDWEAEDREWDPEKLEEMRARSAQLDLLDDETWRKTFRIIPKLAYSFYYRFEDEDGQSSKLQILDWEIGALYWNCLRKTGNDEPAALELVKRKYWGEFIEKDLHFFLGTTQSFHFVAPNPWVIIGVLPIPHQTQGELF